VAIAPSAAAPTHFENTFIFLSLLVGLLFLLTSL
jgi:hypothetical protein